jgi:hypothetical protein
VADLDGNGVPDVLMNGISPTYALWRLPDVATGGVAQPPQLLANGAYAHATGHIDSDTYPDLFLAINGQVMLANGLGNGTVGPLGGTGLSISGPNYGVASFIPADLNGDGLDDVVVLTGYAVGFGFYYYTLFAALNTPNNWTVSWTAQVGLGTSCALGDFNGDGRKDLCWLSWNPQTNPPLHVVPGNANGGFGPETTFPLAASTYVLLAADLDGDNLDDVVVYTSNGVNTVLYGNATALLDPPVSVSPPASGGALRAADIDGDGLLDLVFSTQTLRANNLRQTDVSMLRGTGNRTFSASFMPLWSIPPNTTNVPAILVGDFDVDGDPDLFGVPYIGSTMSYIENRAAFGPGCPGQGGTPAIAVGTATLGNPAFAISVIGAPLRPAALGLSLGAVAANGCSPYLDLSPANLLLPAGALGFATTNASGFATVSLPIPGLPSLQGTTAYAQWVIQDPLGGFSVGGGTYSLSRGLTIVAW